MRSLVQEMLDTIELYKSRAEITEPRDGGGTTYVLASRTECGTVLYLHIPLLSFRQAPLQIEKKYKLKGIAGHYKMPEGLSPEDLQTYGQVLFHAQERSDITPGEMQNRMQRVIGLLEDLNPQLKELRRDPNDFMGRYDTILGVASAFSVRDMQFYLDGNSGTVARRNSEWKAMEEKIEKQRGVPLYWIASLETMQDIDLQMELRDIRRKLGWKPPKP